MIKEIFKKQIVVTEIADDTFDFEVRMVAKQEQLKDGALSSLFSSEDNSYQFTGNEKLFFMPGCTVPRFKIKQMNENEGKGICTVKSATKADVIIYGSETSKSIIGNVYDYYTAPMSELETYLEQNYEIGNSLVLKIRNYIEQNREELSEDFVIGGYSLRNHMYSPHRTYAIDNITSKRFWASDEKKLNDLEDMLALNKPVVSQDELIPFLNSGVVMNEDMYNEVRKMFDSKDANNHVLAMELMSNCDTKRSLVYLLFLFTEYHYEINCRSERKHVNFKSLISAIGSEPGDFRGDTDSVIEELIKRKAISSEELPFIMKKYEEEVIDNIGSDYIKHAGIKPNSRLLDAVKEADALKAPQTVEEHVGSDE
jgi:hypothetical protein